jgi:hypothetical protein
MEKKEIYFNKEKAWRQIALGVGILMIVYFVFGLGFIGIFLILLACSYLFVASKSLSQKPQLAFTDEGLYVGFKLHRVLPWKSIESIKIKKVKVDFRNINHIEISSRIKSNGPSNKLVRHFPVQNLDITIEELNLLIDLFTQKKHIVQEESKS